MKGYINAILLGVFGGFCGLQEFYLGRMVLGILAIAFCWTGVPAIVGFIEALVWLFEGEDEFNRKYNSKKPLKPLND